MAACCAWASASSGAAGPPGGGWGPARWCRRRPPASHQAYRAGTAKPLSARSSIGDARPARPQRPHQALEDGHGAPGAVGVARAQDGGDELVGVAVEDQQRVVHVLAVVAVVGGPLLLAVGRVVGPVQVEQDPRGRPAPLPLPEVDRAQGHGQAVAGRRPHRVLQAREGRLAGQVGPRLRQPAADQLEQRVAAQRGRRRSGPRSRRRSGRPAAAPAPPGRAAPAPGATRAPAAASARADAQRGLGLAQPRQARRRRSGGRRRSWPPAAAAAGTAKRSGAAAVADWATAGHLLGSGVVSSPTPLPSGAPRRHVPSTGELSRLTAPRPLPRPLPGTPAGIALRDRAGGRCALAPAAGMT